MLRRPWKTWLWGRTQTFFLNMDHCKNSKYSLVYSLNSKPSKMSNYHALSLLKIFQPCISAGFAILNFTSQSENVAPGVGLNVGGGNWTHSAKKKLTTDVPRVEQPYHTGMQKLAGTWRFLSLPTPFHSSNSIQFNSIQIH